MINSSGLQNWWWCKTIPFPPHSWDSLCCWCPLCNVIATLVQSLRLACSFPAECPSVVLIVVVCSTLFFFVLVYFHVCVGLFALLLIVMFVICCHVVHGIGGLKWRLVVRFGNIGDDIRMWLLALFCFFPLMSLMPHHLLLITVHSLLIFVMHLSQRRMHVTRML